MAAPLLQNILFSKCLKYTKCCIIIKKQNIFHLNRFICSSSQNHFHPAIPRKSVWKEFDKSTLPEETKIDFETVEKLEKLALVKFANQEGIEKLNKVIRIADQITLIDTTGIEPMHSVLEDRTCPLRDDVETEGGNVEEIMRNAAKTCEEYFVVPSAVTEMLHCLS
ncbi:glutamyl-tRNA(Gln) amidotransferase subunit C, mitochondrial-like isoform X2 [Antedon mediterranea]|uniref:glutamyl-tRNA(Gln) amidotransferase subunit C, mitochondrial-like isoform X2 n=1 Tax=Antedon mediterranea TaxID=105859 RepID=UPI003AF6BF5C